MKIEQVGGKPVDRTWCYFSSYGLKVRTAREQPLLGSELCPVQSLLFAWRDSGMAVNPTAFDPAQIPVLSAHSIVCFVADLVT